MDEDDLEEEEMPELEEALTREQRMVIHKDVNAYKTTDLRWNYQATFYVWFMKVVLLVVFMFGAYKIAELYAPK